MLISILDAQIVLILVGVVWGLGEGFGIAAAGTILVSRPGELQKEHWLTSFAVGDVGRNRQLYVRISRPVCYLC